MPRFCVFFVFFKLQFAYIYEKGSWAKGEKWKYPWETMTGRQLPVAFIGKKSSVETPALVWGNAVSKAGRRDTGKVPVGPRKCHDLFWWWFCFGSYESTCMTRTRKAAKSDLPFDLFGSVKKKKTIKTLYTTLQKKKKARIVRESPQKHAQRFGSTLVRHSSTAGISSRRKGVKKLNNHHQKKNLLRIQDLPGVGLGEGEVQGEEALRSLRVARSSPRTP